MAGLNNLAPGAKRADRKEGARVGWWARLSVRMTLSYLAVAFTTALVLEFIVATVAFLAISVLLHNVVPITVRNAARTYASQAAFQATSTALEPRSTFQPGQPFSLALPEENRTDTFSLPYVDDQVPYLAPHAPSRSGNNAHDDSFSIQITGFALLVRPDGTILAGSDPAHYPASTAITHLLSKQGVQAVSNALKGQRAEGNFSARQDDFVFSVQPVLSKEKRVLGAVYVQILTTSQSVLLQEFTLAVFRSGVPLLLLLIPPSALLGSLSTRGQVRRIHQLVKATERFAGGDYTQRIPGKKRDEIGQLEAQFNTMAEQLVSSIEQQRRLTEQQARMEERARIEQELHTARQIQRSLLPKTLPTLPGWQIAAHYQPAREVGGDLYDFLPLSNGRLGVIIGDVAGKGVPAALMMANVRSMLHAAAQVLDAPGAVLAHVNDLLCADAPDMSAKMFLTCFYAFLEPESGRLRYANAGHDLPYLRSSGSVTEVERATGMPLGMLPGMHYEEQEIMLAPGVDLLFYSDGLVEAHNSAREMFGLPRLQTTLQRIPQTLLIDALLDELSRFTGEAWEQEDDVTLVTLQRI